HYQLGRAYLGLRNLDSAYTELSEAARIDPANADTQLWLASVLLARRRLEEAQAIAEKVLAADPVNTRAHSIIGEKHTLMQDFPRAVAAFQKVVQLEPGRVENYAALGAAWLASGRAAEAE